VNRRTSSCARQWISYRRFLDTQREGRRTCRIKKQQGETAWRGQKRFLCAGGADTLCNKTKQPGFEGEALKRKRDSRAQCKNDQSVFGIVSGLNRVIPTIERFKDWTNKAGQQNNHSRYTRRPRPHDFEYSAAGSQGGKQNIAVVGLAGTVWVLEVDIGKVRRLRAEGFGLRVIAERLGISVNALQKARGQARDSCGQSVSHSRSSAAKVPQIGFSLHRTRD
jgi:hypothetical protein